METLIADLEGLENRYGHVSGVSLIRARDRALEVHQAARTSEEGDEQGEDVDHELSRILTATYGQLTADLEEGQNRRDELILGLRRLMENEDEVWSGELWRSNIRSRLEGLERDFVDQTGLGVVALLWEVDSSSREEMKEGMGALASALENEIGVDEGDLADLLGDLDALSQQLAGSDSTQRLHVDLLLENHSQLGTVVPRKGRIQFVVDDGSTEEVDLSTAEDVRMVGHSVVSMQLASRGLGDLDDEVAELLRGLEGRLAGCEVVVLDLSGRPWFGSCGKVSRAVSLDERLKQAMSQMGL